MNSGKETAAVPPRTISRTAFEWLVIVTFVLLTVIEFLVALAVGGALGVRSDEGGMMGGLCVLNMVVARVAVDGVLKRFGLSRSGKSLEVRGRTAATPDGEVADGEVVEVRLPNATIRLLFWGGLFFCTFLAAIPILMQRLDTGTGILSVTMAGLFGLGALNIWWDRGPQARADRDGITGYPVGFALRRRFVPWSAVATCEIETFHDTFGKPVIVRPILKGWQGEALMTLNMPYTKWEDQERLVKYIKAKLPKPKPDPWEW